MRDRPPVRRFRLKLDLQADGMEELARVVDGVLYRVYESIDTGRALTKVTSGGVASGFHLELTEQDDMTSEKYRKELDAWVSRVE